MTPTVKNPRRDKARSQVWVAWPPRPASSPGVLLPAPVIAGLDGDCAKLPPRLLDGSADRQALRPQP